MHRFLLILFLIITCKVSVANAEGVEAVLSSDSGGAVAGVYVGAGVSLNSQHDFDDASGVQVFVGLPLDLNLQDEIKAFAEAGFMSSGSFEDRECFPVRGPLVGACLDFKDKREGAWVAGLGEYKFSEQIAGLIRFGLDIGDDDGLFMGFGTSLDFDSKILGRLEYIARDETDSIQLNFVLKI